MGLFSTSHSRWLDYFIVLTDPVLVKTYQTQFPYGYAYAPYNPHDNATGQPGGAAVAFQAPWSGATPGATAPYTWSPVFTAANNYDAAVATFTRKTGGFWGIGGDEVEYRWVGQFQLADPPTPTVNTVPVVAVTNIPKRSWCEGYEMGAVGWGGSTLQQAGVTVSRDASRHVGGLGLALRGPQVATAEYKLADFNPGYTSQFSWERFYVRVRQADPGQTVPVWECFAVESGNYGARIDIQMGADATKAQFALYSKRAGAYTLRATGGVMPVWSGSGPTNGFHKVDILLKYTYDPPPFLGPVPGNVYLPGSIRVYLDGVLSAQFSDTQGTGGLGSGNAPQQAWHHRGSILGNSAIGVANELYCDIDDYMRADIPGQTVGGLEMLLSRDWLAGTKIVPVRPKAYSPNHNGAAWSGDVRILAQLLLAPAQDALAGASHVDSGTSGAILEVDTDSDRSIDASNGGSASAPIGVASIMVGIVSTSVNNTDGQLGYGLAGAAPVMATIDQTVGIKSNNAFYTVPGTSPTCADVTPLRLRFTKAATGDAVTVGQIMAQAELIGAFDEADYRPSESGPVSIPNGDTHALFLSLVAGRPFAQQTLVDLEPTFQRYGIALTPPNAAGDRTKIGDPVSGRWTRVGFGEGDWVWLVQSDVYIPQPAGTPDFPAWVGQHNAAYPLSQWATAPHYAPNGPFIVYADTYVGNGTAQDLQFASPITFFYARPTTGDLGGFKWWPTMQGGAHKGSDRNPHPSLANVDEDPTYAPGAGDNIAQRRYRVRIVGAEAQFNAVGVTYEYIAVSDPSARFLLAGSLAFRTGSVGPIDNVLVNAGFTPELALFWPETWNGSAGGGLYLKGPQNAAQTVSGFAATAAVLSALSFATGKLTTLAPFHALHASAGQAPYLLFRRADGNNDPGQAAVMAILSWTGDGTASRTISIAPASGKRPLFALATGDAAAGGFQRDPSHLTTHSTSAIGGDSTTGITGGGIDSISVGSALNTNGVNYNMLVLFGGTTAGNGGFSINGIFSPVQADYPTDGPWTPPPDPSVFTQVTPVVPLVGQPDIDQGTVLLDASTDIGGLLGGQPCEYYTRALVNIALTRIGMSQRVVDLVADETEAAELLRSHVLEDVNTTLRAFDWPFATRYATLALVAGSDAAPVNDDWTFAYRLPAACMKARRLVNPNRIGREFDPNPPKFRLGSDDSGPLLYTHERNDVTPLTLEYTVRHFCPALFGDALFRDALAWKFAESLAPGLAKDTKKQDYCRQRFMLAIATAKTPAAQEQQQAKPGEPDWLSDRN